MGKIVGIVLSIIGLVMWGVDYFIFTSVGALTAYSHGDINMDNICKILGIVACIFGIAMWGMCFFILTTIWGDIWGVELTPCGSIHRYW